MIKVIKTTQFIIPGEPKTLKRAYVFKGGAFDQSKTEKGVILAFAYPHRPTEPFRGPIRLSVRFEFSRPKSHFKTGANCAVLRPGSPDLCLGKKDLSNLIKIIEDALEGVFWHNDSIICLYGEIGKFYSQTPQTTVTIEYLSEHP